MFATMPLKLHMSNVFVPSDLLPKLLHTTTTGSCLKTGPAGAYKLCHTWSKRL